MAVASDCIGALAEDDTYRPKHKRNTVIAHAQLPTSLASRTCEFMGYVRRVGWAHCKKQQTKQW